MDTILKHDIEEAFAGKLWAFTAIVAENGYRLGIAESNIAGYTPVPKWYETYAEAQKAADELNEERGITKIAALDIIASSMAQGSTNINAKYFAKIKEAETDLNRPLRDGELRDLILDNFAEVDGSGSAGVIVQAYRKYSGTTEPKDDYEEILAREITDTYNEIDQARDLLSMLLADPEQLIGDDAGAIIQHAIDLIE